MQKRSFGHLPLTYRPYDFPASFPVLAFLGDYWINGTSEPDFLHFHNGIEIGCCRGGSGQIYCGESESIFYQPGDYSVIFPYVPHIVVNGTDPGVWEYLYVEPRMFFQDEGQGYGALWQCFYIFQRLPVIIRQEQFPVLYLYISEIFKEFHQKKALYQRAVHGLLAALCAEMNRLTLTGDNPVLFSCDSSDDSSGNCPGSPIFMNTIQIPSPYGICLLIAASVRAISADCLRGWWASVHWSIFSIIAFSRHAI